MGGGRNGTNALHISGYVQKTGLGGSSTVIVGCAIKVKSGGGPFGQLFRFLQAGQTHCRLYVLSDMTLAVVNYNGTTLGVSSTALQQDIYAYVECKITFAGGSSGTYDVRINGVSVLSGSGVTTNPNVAASINSLRLGYEAGDALDAMLDDFYMADAQGSTNNDFLGDVMIQPLYPAGAGATTQWTPSANANWQNVSEHVPDDDATYNKTGVAAKVDLYALDQITGSAPTIFGVQWNAQIRKNDASSYVLNRAIRTGTTTFLGSALLTPNTSYANFSECLDLDPNTGTAWTKTTVNAMQAGQKLVSVV